MTGFVGLFSDRSVFPWLAYLCPLLFGCAVPVATGTRDNRRQSHTTILPADVRRILFSLADDSMQGRRTGTDGARRAARYIADEMRAIGLSPAGDSGYFQRVPLAMRPRESGPPRLYKLGNWSDYDNLPVSRRIINANLIGILWGTDPTLCDTAVILSAHYDHHGIDRIASGDSILNGADDNATGVVTVLEVARWLARGSPLRRSVVFLLTTGEEIGMLGVDWYVAHPVVPLSRTIANLQIEMTGRPDSLVGGFGHAWLTGDERSTMGRIFRDEGLLVSPDPRPEQKFFERSDNIAFARAGIPAHTLSTFNLHSDYHQLTDEASRIDIEHLTAITITTAKAVRRLADGPPPTWIANGRPRAH